MKRRLAMIMMALPVLATAVVANAQEPFELEFGGSVETCGTVVDGVMGGRSSGQVGLSVPGILLFTGDISLENNGGFSQMRTNVSGQGFAEAQGIELRVRGDGRTYKFDVRCSNVRMMAGAYQRDFATRSGEWLTIRLPFDNFRLYSFGRRVSSSPALDPLLIESIGVTLADKKTGPFRLEIDSIRAYGDSKRAVDPAENDLASVASGAGLGTLMSALKAAEFELPEGQQFTIFAPTDEAFAAIPKDELGRLLRPENRDTLRSILTYHVAPMNMSSADLLSRRWIKTLNGQRLKIDTSGPISIGDSKVIAVDVPFQGGVVHVIDTVLMPELNSIQELAAETSELSTLAAAVAAAGLGEQLSAANGPWTIFAPLDSAFATLPAGALDDLLLAENRSSIIDILGLHVVPGRIYASELPAIQRAQTLYGESIEFRIEAGGIRVGDASVVTADIEAGNGVVHLIDAVLLPVAPETSPASVSRGTEAAALCELAISRGAPLFNAGQPAACATIYEIAIEALVTLGSDGLDRGVVQRLEMALAEAETQDDWTDRAWTLRRALDAVYLKLSS